MSLRRARTARSLLAVTALTLAVPAGASADIAITSLKAGPVPSYNHVSGLPLTSGAPFGTSFDSGCSYGALGAPIDTTAPDSPLALSTQAGVNTDYCVAFRLSREDAILGQDLASTMVQLPVGSLAEIDAANKCTVEAFARESTALTNCPTSSQVGTALGQLQVATGAATRVVQDAPGRIFALSTPADKAALLGVALVGSSPAGTAETKFLITVTQPGSPTIGLQNQTDTLSRVLTQSSNAPLAIWANALRFWGKAAEHVHVGNKGGTPAAPAADFFRVATTCQTPQTTALFVNPYTGTNAATGAPYSGTTNQTGANTAPFKLTGCENLPFNPTFSAKLTGDTSPGAHPGLAVSITSPPGDQDLGATKITLPIGVATDLSRIQDSCPQATFEAGGCTDGTVIGVVKATLTGINADVVSGVVHKVKIDGKVLPALGFDFKGRLPLRVAGISEVDPAGRLVNTFTDLPSIPQRSLDIALLGGDKGILQLPNNNKCTTSAFDAVITSQNTAQKIFSLPTTCGEQFKASIKKADQSRPTLYLSGAGATGKKVESIRLEMPSGLTVRRNVVKSKTKIDKLEDDADGRTTRSRLNKKQIRFTIPKPGSNGLRIMTRTGALAASSKFRKRENDISLKLRIVYTDGSKANVSVPLERK